MKQTQSDKSIQISRYMRLNFALSTFSWNIIYI